MIYRYFEDRELLDSVEKDVLRTYPEHEFFDDGAKIALKAILFIYGKLNPGVSYVQGMNELAGTLYFVFANNKLSRDWIDNAEADTFFCFTALMSEFQDLFIYRLDDTSRGLQGTIERYCQLLAAEDPHLHEELCNQGLEATFYTVRWVTTLFSREFDLLDTIRLWDSLFADADQHEFLSFMCYTMTAEQRDFIFANEFADNLKMLQSYPLKDVPHLLQMLEGTRSAVRNNIPRNPPRHPLKPDAKVDHAESSGSYFSSTGRQLIYDQLRNVDAEAIKVTSYQLLSNSINRIISTAGNALDAYNNSNFNDGSEFEDAVSSPGIDELNGPTFCRANVGSDLPTSSVVKTTQETAANASKWTWQGIGNLMSLAVQASAQLSKNITPEPVSGDNAEIIMASTIDPPLE